MAVMLRLGMRGIFAGFLAALVVFPVLTFATPVSIADGIASGKVVLSLTPSPADDGIQWYMASDGSLSLLEERSAQAELGGFVLPSLQSFPEVAASDDKALSPDADPQGSMIRLLLLIILFGALVRYLTSPAYYRFISEVLDPRIY